MKRVSFALLFAFVFPSLVFAAKNPADYPLTVHILETQWRTDGRGYYRGWGRGNIKDGESVHGFDFTYDGCSPLKVTVGEAQKYPGIWKKDKLQLEILAAEIGKVDKFSSCDLKTSVSEGVYMRGPGGLTWLSQQQFADWLARREAYNARQQTGTGVAPRPMSPSQAIRPQGARVSISSDPAGAEIEVDGSLMGDTPSSIDLLVGEHKVTVRKQGFKPWERTVKIASGLVSLNADLEKDTPK